MKIGKNKLKMSSGEVRTFKSEKARDNFERVAQATKHGWKPTHHSADDGKFLTSRKAKFGIKE
jgi:hypothetical protein